MYIDWLIECPDFLTVCKWFLHLINGFYKDFISCIIHYFLMYHIIFCDGYVVGSCVLFAFILNHAALKILVYRSSCVTESIVSQRHEFFKEGSWQCGSFQKCCTSYIATHGGPEVCHVCTFKCETLFFVAWDGHVITV